MKGYYDWRGPSAFWDALYEHKMYRSIGPVDPKKSVMRIIFRKAQNRLEYNKIE